MAKRTRKPGKKEPTMMRRVEDRAPGQHGISIGAMRRGSEVHAVPGKQELLFGSTPGLSVTVGVSNGMVRVVADVPGMDAGNVVVSAGTDFVTLRGVHCRFGAFSHEIRLPEAVRGDQRRVAANRTQLCIDLPLEDDSGGPAC